MSAIKEHPILFSGPMMRAILEGRKMQTRRVVKPGPPDDGGMFAYEWGWRYEGVDYKQGVFETCPYGQPGDLLWVRETFTATRAGECSSIPLYPPNDIVLYRADPIYDGMEPGDFAWRWTPSIFMPRWASRLTLRITEVRVQRVQEITEDDARAEGCGGYVAGEGPVSERGLAIEPGYWHPRFYRAGFEDVWDSINAKRGYSWESNPWVWCLTFSVAK